MHQYHKNISVGHGLFTAAVILSLAFLPLTSAGKSICSGIRRMLPRTGNRLADT